MLSAPCKSQLMLHPGSLKRLQHDYVDIVFAHRPDPSVPMEEVVRAFNWVIDQGWAFYWGTSEWSGQQLLEANEIAEKLGLVGPAAEQPEYHIFQRTKVEKDFSPVYEKYGLGLTTWSPLASGVLTGKYSGGKIPPGSRLSIEKYSVRSMVLSLICEWDRNVVGEWT